MRKEFNLNKNDLELAIKYAWDNQLDLVIYPCEMNLIVVDKDIETMYLRYSHFVSSTSFNTIDEMKSHVEELEILN